MAFPHDVDPAAPGLHDKLKLAFAVWISKLISEADGYLDLEEIRLLNDAFPNDLLQAFGLMDDNADFTPAYHRARKEALRVLPGALSTEDKLQIVTVFHEFCVANNEILQAELLILREAAEALGIDVRQLSQHLRTLS